MTGSASDGDTSTSLTAIEGLVDMGPFLALLSGRMAQGEDENSSTPQVQIAVDGLRERISLGVELVARIGCLSVDAAAVAVAASFSGSPFRLAWLMPFLTFPEGRARQALSELEELKIVVVLDEDCRAMACLKLPFDPAVDGRSAMAVMPSRRERDVARLIARGLTNYQIGMRLGLSQRTVETYVRRLFEKLDVTSRSQIVAWHVSRNANDERYSR